MSDKDIKKDFGGYSSGNDKSKNTKDDIDFIVVRENTGGLYTGHGGISRKGTPHEVATQVMVYDRQMVDRCLKYSFDLAMERKKEGINKKENKN